MGSGLPKKKIYEQDPIALKNEETNLIWPYFVMNFLNSNFSGSYISTLGGKTVEEGAIIKLVTNSIFIETTPPNPRLKIKFGSNLH